MVKRNRFLSPPSGLPHSLASMGKNVPEDFHLRAHPRYYFRGEPDIYASTTSSLSRMQANPDLSASAKTELLSLVTWVEQKLSETMGMSLLYAKGYYQHYGLPGEFIDFTSDVRVAGLFACMPCKNADAQYGAIGVLDTCNLICMCPEIPCAWRMIDLTEHPKGYRPRRQSAYGFLHREFPDLKDCWPRVRVYWYKFRKPKPISSPSCNPLAQIDILDAANDPFAGLLRNTISQYVKEAGPLAAWLSCKVVPAHLHVRVEKVIGPGEFEVRLMTAADAECHSNEDREREKAFRFWTRPVRCPGWVLLFQDPLDVIRRLQDQSLNGLALVLSESHHHFAASLSAAIAARCNAQKQAGRGHMVGHTSRSGVVPFSGTPTKKRLKARCFQPLYSDDF